MSANSEYLPLGGASPPLPPTSTLRSHLPPLPRFPPSTPRVRIFTLRLSLPPHTHLTRPFRIFSAGSVPPAPRTTSQTATTIMGIMFACSALLNVAQFAGARSVPGVALGASPHLGWSSAAARTHAFARMEDPRPDGNCGAGLVHMCIDEASAANSATGAGSSAALGTSPERSRVPRLGQDPSAEIVAADMDATDTFEQAGFSPGEDATQPAEGGARYCRKDTWLLSCLFYKADVNDELTDWKSVKQECDREPLCDGVNKYWTSDLWHISSSGEAPGCDVSLRDGYGTDASAFYKEGSPGFEMYYKDGSCHEVDEWGNPRP